MTSLFEKYPEIVAALWDFDENTCDPHNIGASSKKTVSWYCNKGCGNHKWKQNPADFLRKKHDISKLCPFCSSGHRICPCKCNSLAKKKPLLVAEIWDYEKNIDKDPLDITCKNITYKAWWKCKKGCGHHMWQKSVAEQGSGCVFCQGKQVCPCGCNSIAQNERMASMWHPCNEKDPRNIISGSTFDYWWSCDKGCGNHSWQTDAFNVRTGSGCPICCGKKICPCKCNAVSTTNPEIIAIWSADNVVSPDEVTKCSDKRIKFICDQHGTWETCLKNVAKLGAGCPKCGKERTAKKLSLPEQVFRERCLQKYGDKFTYENLNFTGIHNKVNITCKQHGSFLAVAARLISNAVTHGCPSCSRSSYSRVQILWLRHMEASLGLEPNSIQHALNGTEFKIPQTNFRVDGYCKATNTVFEFYGDFWHGNPKFFPGTMMHPFSHVPMQELYDKTLEREDIIKKLGYGFVSIWEHEWNDLQKQLKSNA